MDEKPGFIRGETTATFVQASPSESEKGNASVPLVAAGETSSTKTESIHRVRTSDIVYVVGILVMLWWPWIIFGVLWARGGVQLKNHFAKVVSAHPQTTNFFITLLGTIVRLAVAYLFSKSILRFSQEWMDQHNVTIFHVSLITAFRNQKPWPWGLPGKQDRKYIFAKNRRFRVVLVLACFAAFMTVPSSITSLITPVPFDRNTTLTGTELDFATTDSTCLDWLNANPILNNCDWGTYNGLSYTTCLGQNQEVDVLESGRGNILSLISNNTETVGFSQLGAKGGLQFLGPIRGVLPIGPNGVPAFNKLDPSPFSDAKTTAGMLSYNYTLELQGLVSNITCIYDTQSPITPALVPGETLPLVAQYNATCSGAAQVLTNVTQYIQPNGNNSLVYWACQSVPDGAQEPSYFVYLQGRGGYTSGIGDITCTISPIQPAIFPVTYQSSPGVFRTKEQITSSPTTFSGVVEQALVALGGVISEGQSFQANQVAESVITAGVKSFGLSSKTQNPEYLKLYEAMIQGILEYEATYVRLIYSATAGMPSSCNRAVTGTVSYSVLGWSAKPEHIGFLMPMTIVNLTSLVIILLAVYKARSNSYAEDPTEARRLVLAKHSKDKEDSSPWADHVTYEEPREETEEESEEASPSHDDNAAKK